MTAQPKMIYHEPDHWKYGNGKNDAGVEVSLAQIPMRSASGWFPTCYRILHTSVSTYDDDPEPVEPDELLTVKTDAAAIRYAIEVFDELRADATVNMSPMTP